MIFMRVVRVAQDVPGIPLPNETRLVLTQQLPDEQLVTGAFVLAFMGEELVLTHLKNRGWDIPGGHPEQGESPDEAMRRELYEETGAIIGHYGILGYEKIRLLGPRPENYKYPYPDSYMAFYWAAVSRLDDIPSSEETYGRGVFNPEEASKISWIVHNFAFYEEAVKNLPDQTD
jgi:8-oxo-dGTP pyrophosphatase MutT (NUDIX family)